MSDQSDISVRSGNIFGEIFKASVEGIIIVDKDGNILVANHASEAMFGYAEGGLFGLGLEQLLPERYRKNHVNLRDMFMAKPEPRVMGAGRDLMASRKDGSEFPVEISLSFVQLKSTILVMAFIIDISIRKKVEEKVKKSEEQLVIYAAELEKKVQSRTEALALINLDLQNQIAERQKAEEESRRALDKEKELNELKSKFVYIASHEFRTPLSTILSSASLAQQYRERSELEKLDKHLQRIKDSVKHLTSILNDFLSLGKLEEGKVEIIKEFIHPESFFIEIKEEIKSTLKEGQQIQIDTNSEVALFETDPRILRNILFNLLSNASKYSETNKRIFLSSQIEDHHLSINVRDEGIGIPEKDLKHISDRFFRASNAGNIRGTGLGLNIVKRYTDLLKGKMSFQSKFGEGSTFTISLPINFTDL